VITAVDVARDNDRFRVLGDGKGRTLISEGVANVRHAHRIINAVRGFNSFRARHADPEHRFGEVEVAGEKCCFTVDYYADATLQQSADPHKGPVYRVLSIMLASERKGS